MENKYQFMYGKQKDVLDKLRASDHYDSEDVFDSILMYNSRKMYPDTGYRGREVYGVLNDGSVRKIGIGCDDLSFYESTSRNKRKDFSEFTPFIKCDSYRNGLIRFHGAFFWIRMAGGSIDILVN